MQMTRHRSVKTVALSKAKAGFSRLVDEANHHDEDVVITVNGRPVAVLMSIGQFESWREARSVRTDAGLMREIKSGLRMLKASKASKARFYARDKLSR